MERIFIVNEREHIKKTYEDLLKDLNKSEFNFSPIIRAADIYDLYLQVIVSILLEKEVSFDFISNGIESNQATTKIKNPYQFATIDECLTVISESTKWKLKLSTSGTTGLPKKVTHSFTSLTRSIKVGHKRANDIWGLAYNPQHMAGLQVFFQAFLNKNTIVNVFGLDRNHIFSCIKQYNITHLSATPTFYKMLLPAKESFNKVLQVTYGGERFSESLQNNMTTLFPNAKFTNVYASTEAGALFAALGNHFTISEKMKSFVRIDENELMIHRSILASADDLELENDWYATGDMVNLINDNPITFNFLSRKNEMINVGGSKVNPNEVEEIIMSMTGIVDVKVFGKENSLMGNIICADIVTESVTEKEIKSFVKDHLPGYMVPRIIKFVAEISQTSTGKKSRI